MKKIIFLITLFLSLQTYAQQDAHYTQYMYNMSVVNPAYMINEPGVYQVGSLYRTQWVGVSGAPKTTNIFAHIPINNQIEISANYINDNIGSKINLTRNLFNVDLAYKIKLDAVKNLSFGLKPGIANFTLNPNGSDLFNDTSIESINKSKFMMGAGVFLFTEDYFVGLSAPNLVPIQIENENADRIFTASSHINLIGGYIFYLSDSFKFKPSAIIKGAVGSVLSIDVSANVLYNNRFELGISYRINDAFSAMAVVNINPSLRIGYAYDYSINDLKNFTNGSHEFILLYKFDFLSLGKKYTSPRFY